MREGYSDDVLDAAGAGLEDAHDARHQFGGLAGAGRGLHQQALMERIVDAFARGPVVQFDANLGRHGRLRSTFKSSSRFLGFLCVRCSS